MLWWIFRALDRLSPPRVASAHCAIPCGLYDPGALQLAALTVVRMCQLFDQTEDADTVEVIRLAAVKEDHARKCEHEISVLANQYFTPAHYAQNEGLDDLIDAIGKMSVEVRQDFDIDLTQGLLDATREVALIFWQTKNVPVSRVAAYQDVMGSGFEVVLPSYPG